MGFFKAGKYVEAVAEFQALVDHSPRYGYGYFMLGNCLLKLQRLEEAERSFRKALELDSGKFEYRYGLASSLLAGRRYAEAVAALTSAESLLTEPDRYAFHSLRGFALAGERDWRGAADDLERAAALKPSAAVLTQLGRAHFGLGDIDKAVRDFEESVRIDPSDADTLRLLAEAQLDRAAAAVDDEAKKTLYSAALHAAQRLSTLRPSSHEGPNLVGRAALGARDLTMADEAFRHVLSLKPDHCYAMVNLSKCAIAEERWDQAEKRLLDAARCGPKLAVIPETLSFVYAKRGKLRESLDACRRADALQPTESTRACIAAAQDRLDRATTDEADRRRKVEEYEHKHRPD